MSQIRAVISDFGGVLTNPLWEAFAAWNENVGADPGVLGMALQKAAELSSKGALYVRLGQVRLLKEDYNGALTALKSGLAKGSLDDPGSVEMLIGITYYNSGKPGEARGWFEKSKRSEKARPTAEAWIKHIDEELAKQNGESTGPAGSVGM